MAGTLAATEIGGGSSLGVVRNGISAAWYIVTMDQAFVILTFMAPKFRAATVKTVPEYFRCRYGKSAGMVTAVIMLLPLIGLTAGQFIASAVFLSTMLGISGSGAMRDFDDENPVPWDSERISQVLIENGVTSVGDYAFYLCQ